MKSAATVPPPFPRSPEPPETQLIPNEGAILLASGDGFGSLAWSNDSPLRSFPTISLESSLSQQNLFAKEIEFYNSGTYMRLTFTVADG